MDLGMATPTEATSGSWSGRPRLLDFSVPSEPGGEVALTEQIAAAAARLGLSDRRLDRLKTAVAEAIMNAMEHGNGYRAELPVRVQLDASDSRLRVCIADRGQVMPTAERELPDLEAKLEGLQSTRGWGLFLIERMTDELATYCVDGCNTVELTFYLRERGEIGETGEAESAGHARGRLNVNRTA